MKAGSIFPLFAVFITVMLCSEKVYSQVPEPPRMSRVTVLPSNEEVLIEWEASPSADVDGYYVYVYEVVGQNNPIPSSGKRIPGLVTDLFLVHDNPDVTRMPVGYTVTAVNSTGESIETRNDSTIHLSLVDIDSCNSTLTLEWNDYNSWRSTLLNYVLVIDENGAFSNIVQLSADQNSVELNNLTAGNAYSFTLTAFNYDGLSSSSNSVETNISHRAYPEYIYANYATVNSQNNPELQFTIDPASELTYYSLWRSETPNEFNEQIGEINTTEKTIIYTDTEADASETPYYYQMRAINEFCENSAVRHSNVASTIALSATFDGEDILLNWNNYTHWAGGVSGYDVVRISATGEEIISNTQGTAFSEYIHDLSSEQNSVSAQLCYRIVAHEGAGNPLPVSASQSVSNIACVYLPPGIEFPHNAIIPEDPDNNAFAPEMDFIPNEYELKIFNRWGNLIFQTTDPYQAWYGNNNGRVVPEGVYRFQVTYLNDLGKQSVIHGNVTVVRR